MHLPSPKANLYLYKRPADQLPKRKSWRSQIFILGLQPICSDHMQPDRRCLFPRSTPQMGIETGYRVQANVQAKATRVNYKPILLYQMVSLLLYNVWHYANFLLCRAFS
jgi:hypothetical protein